MDYDYNSMEDNYEYEINEDQIIVEGSEDDSDNISYSSNGSSDWSSDSTIRNNNDIYMIYDDEDMEYIDEEKKNLKYYIGLPAYIETENEFVLMSTISPAAFHKYNINTITEYIYQYSIMYIPHPTPHILQLFIKSDGVYSVIIKTYWLRIIQRTWRNICKKRRLIEKKAMQLSYLRSREIGGTLLNYPGLYGMLQCV
jgi:hypothetical protein